MSNAETLTLLIAGASCVATALATLAALRSARSAEAAQAALIEAAQREVRRQVAELVAEIEREHRRAKFLAHTLQVIDRANAVMSGTFGGSRGKLLEKGIENRLQEAEALAKAGKELLERPHTISTLTVEDAERIRLDRTVDLARLRSINDELARDSESR
jgi:DNA repair exonuclease SbcCD ATPase subunit